jgi:hypothetical protein
MILRSLLAVFLFALISAPLSARDFENAYAVYGAGAEPCKHYSLAVEKGGAAEDFFNDWVIGYLSAFNVIIPETHNILGEMGFPLAQRWLQRHCRRYPNELFVNATARLTEVLYPARFKSGLKDAAPKNTPSTQVTNE